VNKINEDSWVLDKGDLSIIEGAFESCIEQHNNFWKKYNITMKFIPSYMPELFKKITLLNDIVKYMEERGLLVYGGDAELVLSKRGKEKLGINNE